MMNIFQSNKMKMNFNILIMFCLLWAALLAIPEKDQRDLRFMPIVNVALLTIYEEQTD